MSPHLRHSILERLTEPFLQRNLPSDVHETTPPFLPEQGVFLALAAVGATAMAMDRKRIVICIIGFDIASPDASYTLLESRKSRVAHARDA